MTESVGHLLVRHGLVAIGADTAKLLESVGHPVIEIFDFETHRMQNYTSPELAEVTRVFGHWQESALLVLLRKPRYVWIREMALEAIRGEAS